MLKIKKEMIDKAIEKEKSNREKSEKLTVKVAIAFLIIVFVEIFLLTGLLSVNAGVAGILKTLKATAIFIIADIVYFFAAVEAIMRINTTEPPYPAIFSFYFAYMRKRFTARLNAAPTVEDKIRIYEDNLKKAVFKHRKVSAAIEYLEFLTQMQLDKSFNVPDKLYEIISNSKPKKILLKFTRLQGLFNYYIFKEDTAGYIRTFEENSDTISKFWDFDLSAKANIIIYFVQYFEFKNDFQNAVDYCDILMYLNEKACEIDVSLALPEEAFKALSLDYALFFCKLGRWEEAEKYFRGAEEMLADNNIPYVKKQIEAVRNMLNEANNTQKESDTND